MRAAVVGVGLLLATGLAGCWGPGDDRIVIPWPRAGDTVVYHASLHCTGCGDGEDVSVQADVEVAVGDVVTPDAPALGGREFVAVDLKADEMGETYASRILVDRAGFWAGSGDCSLRCSFLRTPVAWGFDSSLFHGMTLDGKAVALDTPQGPVTAEPAGRSGDRISYRLGDPARTLTLQNGRPFAVEERIQVLGVDLNFLAEEYDEGSGAVHVWQRGEGDPSLSCRTAPARPGQAKLPPGADADLFALDATPRELLDAATSQDAHFDGAVRQAPFLRALAVRAGDPSVPTERVVIAQIRAASQSVEVEKSTIAKELVDVPPQYEARAPGPGFTPPPSEEELELPLMEPKPLPFDPATPLVPWGDVYAALPAEGWAMDAYGFTVGPPLDPQGREGVAYWVQRHSDSGKTEVHYVDAATGCLLSFEKRSA